MRCSKNIFCLLTVFVLSINLFAQPESQAGIEQKLRNHFKTETERFNFFDVDPLYKSFFNPQDFNISISTDHITFKTLRHPFLKTENSLALNSVYTSVISLLKQN